MPEHDMRAPCRRASASLTLLASAAAVTLSGAPAARAEPPRPINALCGLTSPTDKILHCDVEPEPGTSPSAEPTAAAPSSAEPAGAAPSPAEPAGAGPSAQPGTPPAVDAPDLLKKLGLSPPERSPRTRPGLTTRFKGAVSTGTTLIYTLTGGAGQTRASLTSASKTPYTLTVLASTGVRAARLTGTAPLRIARDLPAGKFRVTVTGRGAYKLAVTRPSPN